MASVNWMKATTQKAGGLKKHLGQTERENGNHSNEHIDRELSHQNYAIGCDYAEALAQMKARTKEVDEVLPPKRVRKDRVTCCFLELPCPREVAEQGKSDEFFLKAHQLYEDFFGKANVHGTFVHKDEVHEYTAKDGSTQTSLEHAHTLVSAFVEGKGINGKAFETRAKIKALNTAMDEMCVREFGVHLNTGERADRKSVETLKQESEARQELGELQQRVGELQQAEQESRDRFLEADEKATEAESRLKTAEKQASIAEQRTVTAENKLQEVNAQISVANKGLKNVLDKKARASEIKRSIFDRETQSYHINMLERTRAIGSEAYDELQKANETMQQAVVVQTRAERKEQAIEPLYQQVSVAHQQAELERKRAKELREQQEKLIEERAEVRASEMVSKIMQGTPSKERDRMRKYMESLQFNDGTTALEHFEEQERQLYKKLKRSLER